jgi:hypothetical protein
MLDLESLAQPAAPARRTMLVNAVKDACRAFAWLVIACVTILATQGGMGAAAATLPARPAALHTALARPVVVPGNPDPQAGYQVVTTTCRLPQVGGRSIVRRYRYGRDVYALQGAAQLEVYWVAWSQHHPGVLAFVGLWDGSTLLASGAGDCASPMVGPVRAPAVSR